MVQYPTAHHRLPAFGRLGVALAYAGSLVAGTALLIGLFSGPEDARLRGADGQPVTMSEVIMQSTAERALVSPQTAVLAGGTESNEKRGL